MIRILRVVALAVLTAVCSTAALVTIADTLYMANGQAYTGTVDVSWPAFTTSSGTAVPAGSVVYTITAGALSMTLQPTQGSTPSGIAYTARYYGARVRFTETWVVPVTNSVLTLASIRASSTLVIFPSQLYQQGATSNQVLTWNASDGAWKPTAQLVTSVAGRTGAVVIAASDVSGLGPAALLAVGTTAGTVAAGNDSRITGAEQTSNKGQPSGYAGLNSSGGLPIGDIVLPPTTLVTTSATTVDLAAANNGQVLRFTAASAVTLNLSSTVAVAGYSVLLVQRGAGQVTPTAGAGVTIRQRSGYTKTAGQYAIASLVCDVAADCVLSGDIE